MWCWPESRLILEECVVIINRTYELPAEAAHHPGGLLGAFGQAILGETLRWFVSSADHDGFVVDATECGPGLPPPAPLAEPAPWPSDQAVVISVIPTGIGCAVGGYAGDAGPASALLSSACDLLITNPNALNASNFYAAGSRIVYTEGYSIDRFSCGEVDLHIPRANRIGVIIERASDQALAEVFNVINAVRAVHGIDIIDYVVTHEPIATRSLRHGSGAYVGDIGRPHVLLGAARRLLSAGATALAVTTNVQGLTAELYTSHFNGRHPNPVGGAEAVVSHLLTRTFGVPAAHAPMLNFTESHTPAWVVDPRSSGEFVSTSGLACVLLGLHRAPQVARRPDCPASTRISTADVIAVVAPATALGSVPVLAAARSGIPVIAVRDNSTILNVTGASLGLTRVIEVDDYLAAAGALLALRSGISLEAVRRPLAAFGATSLPEQPEPHTAIPQPLSTR